MKKLINLLFFALLMQLSVAQTTNQVPKYDNSIPTPLLIDGTITDYNGKIGIGITSPSQLLDIQGTNDPTIHIKNTSGSSYSWSQILFSNNTNSNAGQLFLNGASNTTYGGTNSFNFLSTTGKISFHTGVLENAMTIIQNGYVGIGTSSPISQLQVNGPGENLVRLQPNIPSENVVLTFGAASASLDRSQIYSTGSGGDVDGDLRVAVGLAGTPIYSAMVIRSNGNVGIGTASPDTKLEVEGQVKITGGTPGIGKVLTSDNDGLATWENLPGGAGWDLIGNTGTIDGTNFIGTLNNVPFNIRVNNEPAGKIDQLLNNTFLGYRAGSTNSDPSATAIRNTAVGNEALFSNSSGIMNSAFGMSALYLNTEGNYNTAIGFNALASSTGSDNTAVGQGAMQYTTTSGNTAMGSSALYYNTTGEKNTAIGFQAGVTGDYTYANTMGSGNTFIGYNSGQGTHHGVNNATAIGYNSIVSGSNCLALGGTGDYAVNVGIATAGPRARLNIYDGGETTDITYFINHVTNAGILVSSDYTARAYTPGIFWQTQDENPGRPKAGIWTYQDGGGSKIIMGTSNKYATGITNTGFVMDASGFVGIGTLTPSASLDVQTYSNGNYAMKILNTGGSGQGLWIKSGSGTGAGAGLLVQTDNGAGTTVDVFKVNNTSMTCYARELIVSLQNPFPDYVFEKGYELMPINEVEQYIAKHKHLPGSPAASEVEATGLNIGNLQIKQQEKIEELMLYIIQQGKQIEKLSAEVEILKAK